MRPISYNSPMRSAEMKYISKSLSRTFELRTLLYMPTFFSSSYLINFVYLTGFLRNAGNVPLPLPWDYQGAAPWHSSRHSLPIQLLQTRSRQEEFLLSFLVPLLPICMALFIPLCTWSNQAVSIVIASSTVISVVVPEKYYSTSLRYFSLAEATLFQYLKSCLETYCVSSLGSVYHSKKLIKSNVDGINHRTKLGGDGNWALIFHHNILMCFIALAIWKFLAYQNQPY